MLSRAEFSDGCREFLRRWNEETPGPSPHRYAKGWRWSPHSSIITDHDLGYLSKDPVDRKLFHENHQHAHQQTPEQEIAECPVDEHEDEAAVPVPPTAFHQPIKLRSSIVYSDTYRVPQLIFQAYKLDGTHLGLEELLRTDIFYRAEFGAEGGARGYPMNLMEATESRGSEPGQRKACSPEEGNEEEEPAVRLPILTRTIHPIDSQPCWALHACNTQAALIDILLSNNHAHPRPLLIVECFFSLISSLIRP